MIPRPVLAGALGAAASLLGGVFAAFSTHDYAQHLDRQLHGTHCSFIPGLGGAQTGDNACKVAMYSPFSAVLKDRFWGGIPISLFGLGAFAFFFAVSLYLLLGKEQVSRRARQGFFALTLAPALASIVMLVVSLAKLGVLCKLCVGIYVSSALLLGAGVLAVLGARPSGGGRADADTTIADPVPWHQKDGKPGATVPGAPLGAQRTLPDRPPVAQGSWAAALGLAVALGLATLAPAGVYAASLPDYRARILGCGKLGTLTEKHKSLVKIPTSRPEQAALSFEDPLCPTCKALHDRLVAEGVYDRLDLTVAIFPLDSECNWMMSKNLHPGACVLARAFLCGDEPGKARAVLEWSYERQEELRELGQKDPALVRAEVKARFPELDACLDAKETKQRLDRVLQFAVQNKVRLSTPQLYLDDQRVCDEDTDMGLPYALGVLSPKLGGPAR